MESYVEYVTLVAYIVSTSSLLSGTKLHRLIFNTDKELGQFKISIVPSESYRCHPNVSISGSMNLYGCDRYAVPGTLTDMPSS